jgi:peroxiredoxin Q/BCP
MPRLFATLAMIFTACTGSRTPAAGPTDADGLLAIGTTAPDLEAVDQTGTTHRLADLKGKWVVVYFYPKDSTPGCTVEACAIRDVWDKFTAADIAVLGVSSGDQASKAAFAKEHRLTFPLLADPQLKWIGAFGVPSRLGFAKRVTFLLSPDGKIAKVYKDVDPGVHARQLLADVEAARHG